MGISTYYFCSRISKGEADATEYVDWAIEQLVKGIDTPSVKILASFMKPLYKPELEEYFYKSLDELGWGFPPFTKNARMCNKYLAEKILDGSLEPIKGAHEICTHCIMTAVRKQFFYRKYISRRIYCLSQYFLRRIGSVY